MSPQPAEPDLRDRLGGALPDSYPAVDLDAVLASGRRTVRRRRFGGLVAVAAAAVVVAVGVTQLTGLLGRSQSELVPAGTVGTVSYDIRWGTDGAARRYLVSALPVVDDKQVVEYSEVTPSGLRSIARSTVDLSRPDARWGYEPGGDVVLGVIPDLKAARYDVESNGGGGEPMDLKRIPGTKLMAFARTTERPLTGSEAVALVRWFEADGKPTDASGMGTAVDVEGTSVWLSADGTSIGYWDRATQEAGTLLMEQPAFSMMQPTTGGQPRMHLVLVSRSGASSGTAVDANGRRQPFTGKRLGSWWAISVTTSVSSDGLNGVRELRWIDGSGRPVVYRLSGAV